MVLIINKNNTYIEISNHDVILLSGNINIDINEDLSIDHDKLKTKLTNILDNTPNKIKFNNKKIYNHIIFYRLIGITIYIKLDKIKNNKYQTNIYYKNIIIHTCKKTIEPYFNYLILQKFKKCPEFNYLFYNDSGFFNDNKVIIDMAESYGKSNERFDMKIYFNNIEKSFGVECFEKHHIDKFDSDLRFEKIRILNKKYHEKDVRFISIFWYDDIFDTKKFNEKFKKNVRDKFNAHNKTKKEYCIEQLFKSVNNTKLCKSIYSSYKSKNKSIIDIVQINSLFVFTNKGEKKYLKYFLLRLKNMYMEEIKMNNKINNNGGDKFKYLFGNNTTNSNANSDADSESESDSNSDSDSDSKSDKLNNTLLINEVSEEEYIKKYFNDNKLTFDGFGHYIQGLGFGNYLQFEKDKFRITEWYNNVMFALIKSFENSYDDLDKLAYGKNIFGLDVDDVDVDDDDNNNDVDNVDIDDDDVDDDVDDDDDIDDDDDDDNDDNESNK